MCLREWPTYQKYGKIALQKLVNLLHTCLQPEGHNNRRNQGHEYGVIFRATQTNLRNLSRLAQPGDFALERLSLLAANLVQLDPRALRQSLQLLGQPPVVRRPRLVANLADLHVQLVARALGVRVLDAEALALALRVGQLRCQ
jgi:hypothetical protein